VATAIVEPFSDGHLQEICKVLGEAATGKRDLGPPRRSTAI
jgi:hypothetical protein